MTSDDAAVRLPAMAQARIAEINASGTWGSALSVAEFAAIRSVGFEPVGQVLGVAVYKLGYEGNHVCPTYRYRTEASAAITRFARGRWSAPTGALAVMSLGKRPAREAVINPMMRSSE